MEKIVLESLLGKHKLSGVDLYEQQIDRYGDGDYLQDCNCIKFILDGNTYTAIEDPSDGYRSCMREIFKDDSKVTNTFQEIEVFIIKTPDSYHSNDSISVYDINNGEKIMEVGTKNDDDYYPSFVAWFSPEKLSLNQ